MALFRSVSSLPNMDPELDSVACGHDVELGHFSDITYTGGHYPPTILERMLS